MAHTNSIDGKTQNSSRPLLMAGMALVILWALFLVVQHIAARKDLSPGIAYQRVEKIEFFSLQRILKEPVTTIATLPFEWRSPAPQPLIVHFWATWCRVCREEGPIFAKLAEAAMKSGVQVLGVVTYDTEKSVLQHNFTTHQYELALDPDGLLAMRWKVDAVPQTLVLNRDGELLRRVRGPLSEHDVLSISKVLSASEMKVR